MSFVLKAPVFPESVSEGTIAEWYKKEGEFVEQGEKLLDIETDKIVLEVPAPESGVVSSILKKAGETIVSQEDIGQLDTSQKAPTKKPAKKSAGKSEAQETPARKPANPAARKLLQENQQTAEDIKGSGKDGRILKEDVLSQNSPKVPESVDENTDETPKAKSSREVTRKPIPRIRQSIAKNLLHAKQSTAMLTTFNQVNMQPIMDIRKKYKEQFEKQHNGVRLGFMSFFVKAASEALHRFPLVNSYFEEQEIVTPHYHDIGVAVSTPRGLMVPILRNCEELDLAGVENAIAGYAQKAKENKIGLEDLQGGTFTISNGGVFGSLLSTPILNVPQTAILGMHKIQDTPVVENGQIVVRPMMYLALSYDHRMIDGKEAVQFLVHIKECVEDPIRILLNI